MTKRIPIMTKDEIYSIDLKQEQQDLIFLAIDLYVLDNNHSCADRAEVICWFHANVLKCDSCRSDYVSDEDFVSAYIDVM